MAFENTLQAIVGYNNALKAGKLIDEGHLTFVLQTLFVDIQDQAGGASSLPVGGTAGQVLTKVNGTDFNTQWTTASTGASGWGLTGNAATAEDFIGTTNNVPLEFKVNNERAGYITTNGNTSFGFQALNPATTGFNNIAVGNFALLFNTVGASNVASGVFALSTNSTGNQNVAVGYQALLFNETGSNNVATGANTLSANRTGLNNTALGTNAGSSITTGSNNIAIGAGAQVATATASNQIRIGNNAISLAQIQVAWTVTSDERFKNTIQNSDLGLNFITSLRPVSYLRNNDTSNKTEYGFIAQELEQALTDVGVEDSGIITKDDAGMLSVRYNDLFAPLVKSIQELKAENDALRFEIDQIKKTL